LPADLAACLLEEGWQQAHVILKQWQCSIDVRSPSCRSSASTASPATRLAAEQAAAVDQQLAAVLIYKPAGVAEVRWSSNMRCWFTACCTQLTLQKYLSTAPVCKQWLHVFAGVKEVWIVAAACNSGATSF
jgi:hypothetical protein